ncbi:CHASE2 domain-containing protein [Marivirga harenae]|uniref:CHASE2 domain-containing protein n=1 Tax=Marivirga harenae TaxID=2010992 RepID=UPI0026DEE101|nr:CHASE2 domain-containing protein [Marivirga harenae]WKV10533.1 CHASE2 domain-containing protein [Marivirga harenae]|tara:strand:- start:490043 stop:491323 length:1281 start_codon:yes stop_codon:yes gene_type:complete
MKGSIFKNIWIDSILATAFIFVVIFGLFSLINVFDAIDPIGEALEDVEFNDIVYSTLREDPSADDNVVLVNIGRLPRHMIAEQIRIINKYNPKVIGLDTFFPFSKGEAQDSALVNAISEVDNIVMATKLERYNELNVVDSLKLSAEKFRVHAEDFGFANLVTGEGVTQEDVKTCRSFVPKDYLYSKDSTHLFFAVRLAQYLAPEKVERFLERDNETEYINYKGNAMGSETNFAPTFFALDIPDVFNENFVPELIEGKIVIFGMLGEYFGDPYTIEDKYYTPLNEKYAGRGKPDMFGAVIHANIISMILDEDYVYKLEEHYQIIIAVLLCYLNVVAFMWVYYRLKNWYDGITKVVQLIELLLILGAIIYSYHLFNINLELTLAMGVVAVVGDSLEVYNGVVKNMFTKEGRRELFSVNKSEIDKVEIN